MTSPAESAEQHGIQGINDGANFLLDTSLVDGTVFIKTEDAKKKVVDIARNHGLLVGISAAANVLAAEEYVSQNPDSDGIVVTILCVVGGIVVGAVVVLDCAVVVHVDILLVVIPVVFAIV